MSEIGRLNPSAPSDLSQFTGYVQTLEHHLHIRVLGDVSLCDNQQPSHRVLARGRSGSEIQVGSAWLKTAKHGPRTGERFLSITIDDPSLKTPLNIAAFP